MQQSLILIIGSVGGAIATFSLQKYGFSTVVASCIIGLAGALIGHLIKSPHLPFVVFAGTFIGMSSLHVGSYPLMIAGGLISGLLYNYSMNFFKGFGGRLGTLAFISTVIAFYALVVIKKLFLKSQQN